MGYGYYRFLCVVSRFGVSTILSVIGYSLGIGHNVGVRDSTIWRDVGGIGYGVFHEYPKGNRYGWFWRLEIWRLIGVLKIGEKIWGISCGVYRDLGYMASIKIYKLNLGRIKGNNGNLCGISSSSIGAIKESILSMSETSHKLGSIERSTTVRVPWDKVFGSPEDQWSTVIFL